MSETPDSAAHEALAPVASVIIHSDAPSAVPAMAGHESHAHLHLGSQAALPQHDLFVPEMDVAELKFAYFL